MDDIADEVKDAGVARTKLAWWRTRGREPLRGPSRSTRSPRALAPFVAPYGLDAARLNEIIDGMEMDLTHHRYAGLRRAQALLPSRGGRGGPALGVDLRLRATRRTLEYAENLGIAFQLTNIIRDVGEDARRDRVYLPADELARFGLAVEDILARRARRGASAKLMAFQAERAESLLRRAPSRSSPPEDRRNQRAGLIMAAIYRTLLDEIRRDGFAVLDRRIALTPLRKLWIAWKTWIAA